MDSLFTHTKVPNVALLRVQGFMHEVVDDWNHATIIRLLSITAGLLIVRRIAMAIHNVWFHPLSKFPGPAHMAAFYLPYLYKNLVSGQIRHTIKKLHRKYGPIVRVGPDHLAIDGSIAWPEVFGLKGEKEFEKVANFLFEGDTSGIIAAPRDVHRRQRRQLGHAFSHGALRDQEAVIGKYVDLLMERLSERSDTGKSFNIIHWMNFTTFDIIGHLTYSESFHCLERNGYHPWLLQSFAGIRGESYRRFLSRYPFAHEIVKALGLSNSINKTGEHKNYIIEKTTERIRLGNYAVEGYSDFMSYMLKKNRDGNLGFVGQEIAISAPLIVGAGSESTATAMSGIIFYLGTSPRAYSRLVEEIRTSFAFEDEITIESTQRLDYLHACLEEILRVFPPVNETPPRTCPGDTIAGKYVPAGTLISVYQEASYHNPEHWTEPDSYNPERWLPESHPFYDPKFENDNRAVFKPFSYGPRDCLGKNLAYTEMRLIVSRMLHRFDLELAPGQENWHSCQRTFLVWERGPLNIYLKRRQAA
ncbi:cytochrome p450 3a17 [Trichoderma cornu-damae]|uniref:Cytochrome p450 3a17 n=1 Tax=Trichoderma cornu-damae TaxID=654480 RepID=A0A9P8TT18_9HYPO|nr:cytochrome p450 3a17 [Trichoderma cornu-damae]